MAHYSCTSRIGPCRCALGGGSCGICISPVCRLTIHSSRNRFAVRLNSGVRGQTNLVARLLGTALLAFSASVSAAKPPTIDLVKVDKSDRVLSLMSQGSVVATFPIVLGGNPVGHKQQEGDQRTPEGRYVLDFK